MRNKLRTLWTRLTAAAIAIVISASAAAAAAVITASVELPRVVGATALGELNAEVPTLEVVAVHGVSGVFGRVLVREAHEGKSAGLLRVVVAGDVHVADFAVSAVINESIPRMSLARHSHPAGRKESLRGLECAPARPSRSGPKPQEHAASRWVALGHGVVEPPHPGKVGLVDHWKAPTHWITTSRRRASSVRRPGYTCLSLDSFVRPSSAKLRLWITACLRHCTSASLRLCITAALLLF